MANARLIDIQFGAARVDLSQAQRKLLWMLRTLEAPTLKRIAALVADRARENAPVRTGTLRDSIKGKIRKARGQNALIATVGSNTKGKPLKRKRKSGEIVTVTGKVNTYGYGRPVEIGKPGGNYKSTPYLRPALVESYPEIARIYKDEYRKGATAANRTPAPTVAYGHVDIPVMGREIQTGARGGRFYSTDTGKRVYVK